MRRLVILLVTAVVAVSANALSLKLDSIAEWGAFPRFCVNTYHWGDKFFNSYDSAYVQGTGMKFNVKLTADSFIDHYSFALPGYRLVNMTSDPSTSVGAYLTYLAVSVGYDINISHLFGAVRDARSRYQFGFNCALLGVETFMETNETGTHITRFVDLKNLDIPFNGIRTTAWGIDVYYFFNHKRYSQAAAFNFSRLQVRSQGSFYAGLSIGAQSYDFDFSMLSPILVEQLPQEWADHHFRTNTHNYGFRFGYGYNIALSHGWAICGTISPVVGWKKGYVNSTINGYSFALSNHVKGSVVWNHGRWFIGGILSHDMALLADRKTTFLGSNLSASGSIGYRFNIW